MEEKRLSEAKRRVVDLLKTQGAMTTAELSDKLGLTDVAVRQHLQSLEASQLVTQQTLPAKGRGRPSLCWSLTEDAAALFPDRHGELTVGLIDALRNAFGQEGLEKVIRTRAERQIDEYRNALPSASSSLKSRVAALARQRTAEGYMAEVVVERPGSYLLVEHHCPICEAATCCTGLCGAELEVFQRALGDDVCVERTSHLLSGDDRCVYRITKA